MMENLNSKTMISHNVDTGLNRFKIKSKKKSTKTKRLTSTTQNKRIVNKKTEL